MKAISLYEPYASFVMAGWKPIETRTHQRLKGLVGQTIIIHATKGFIYDENYFFYMDEGQRKRFEHSIKENEFIRVDKEGKVTGALLGTVEVIGFRPLTEKDSQQAMFNCNGNNRYGLILKNPKWFDKPFPYKGHQGIFTIPPEVMKSIYYKGARKDL